MKRLRDDNYPPVKRPFGASRGESYGQSLSTGGGVGHKLTTNDALLYLKEVKKMFRDQREKYEHFLEVMKDFKAQRIKTEGVIARVKELFKGHNNLIYGFNTFLPKGYEITLDDVEISPKKVVEFDDAISFVNKIKKRFQNDDHVYKSFLEILNLYRKERKSISEVHEEVTHLFEEHPDLLDEFTRFLPHNSAPASVHNVQFGRSTIQRYDEGSTMMQLMPPSQQSDVDQQRLRRDRMNISHTEHDLGVETPDIDDDKTTVKMHKDQKKRGKESFDQRLQDIDDKEHQRNINRESNQQLVDKRKPARKEGPPLVSCDDKNTLKTICNQELVFCEKVKEKLGTSDDYQAFLKCLHLYSTEIISRSELQSLVADLLGKYPDLMEGFKEFLERCENIDGFLAGVSNRKSLWNDGSIPKSMMVEDKNKEKDKELKRDIEGPKEIERNKEKYWAKSIQDLDLSECQRCSPSYRLLPEDYPITTASQRSEVGAQVLNDHWVSVTSGSEDYSFKHMRRNQYEESLFRCEDDRFELDMLLESVSSTAKRVEDLLNSINDRTINMDSPIHIEDNFTALNLRCIERLYSDHGLDVLDTLRKNPGSALPVILTRLKQRQEEWARCRSELNRVWAEVYAKNHYKSLDHRSFYFKQQDSKNLSAKSLVADIKEIKENMQKEDNMLHAVAAGHERSLAPHFIFEYSDVDVHEDIHRLIKYSCEEVCSKEQLHKVMRFWSTFLEPMLSILCQHHHTDGAEDASRANNCTTENVGASALEDGWRPDAEPELDKASSMGDQKSVVTATSTSSVSKELGFFDQGTTHSDNRLNRARADRGLNSVGTVENVPDQVNVFSLPKEESKRGSANLGSGPSNEIKQESDTAQAIKRESDTAQAIKRESDTAQAKGSGVRDPVPASSGNFHDSSGVDHSLPESGSRCKGEKEEGELSPNADFEEDNSVIHEDRNLRVVPEAKVSGNVEDNVLENEGDADDEDSDNGSDAGDDASGSESAGDECSREEHEDEEDGVRDEMDCKAESESEAEIHCNGVDGAGWPVSESFLASVKPVTKYAFREIQEVVNKDCPVFYGSDDFYVLFRLHRMLYERILAAKTNSRSSDAMWNHSKDFSTSDPYTSFMNALFNLLDGTSDNARFEDDCRAIIGNQAYVLFTLDKLIYKLVKQLQAVASDEVDSKLLQLSEYENSRKAGRFLDSVYYENARVILHDENIYRFECAPSPSRLSIRLMDSISEKPDVVAVTMEPNFSAYLYRDFLSVSSCKKESIGLLLQRNKRKYASIDEHSAISLAMEEVQLRNGLECKISCGTSKIFYVLDTEDFFSRPVTKRKSLPAHLAAKLNQRRVQRLHKFLASVPAEHKDETN